MKESARAALDAVRLAQTERQTTAAADARAVTTVQRAVSTTTTAKEAARIALDTIRTEYGWAYGSYWQVSEQDNTLRFLVESGSAGEEFRRVTERPASPKASVWPDGPGVNGTCCSCVTSAS